MTMHDRRSKNVLIITGQHFATAPRKVDLHFIADALEASGHRVDFLSIRLSWLSRFIKDGRWAFATNRLRNRWVSISPKRDEFIWTNIVHPLNLKKSFANALSAPLLRHYGKLLPRAVVARLPAYSHILVESGPAPLLIRQLRAHAPNARIIYHAADSLRTIGVHPAVESMLAETIADYDAIHVMADALRPAATKGVPVLFLRHGISKETFDAAAHSPYAPQSRNAISVGDMLFDGNAISAMAEGNPDWTFHLFGKKAALGRLLPNVITHGEVAFETIVPFIKHADIGIAPYLDNHEANYLSESSLKMIQYTYCRLPIVAPLFAAAGREHVLGYKPGDSQSILHAFEAAKMFDRTQIDTSTVMSWKQKTDLLFA